MRADEKLSAFVELANEITRGKYYERDAVQIALERLSDDRENVFVQKMNRVRTFEVVNDIFSQFRAAADDSQTQRNALWKQNEKEIET